MRISHIAALADIVIGDAQALARDYHEIAVARLGDFDTEEARRRCAIAVRAVGMATEPAAFSEAYAKITGLPRATCKPSVDPVCKRCGGTDLVRDASAQWDSAAQQWELSGFYDSTTCQTCEAESDDLCKWLAQAAPVAAPRPVCRHCGSDRIFHDASTRWDRDAGHWVLADLDDLAFCESCEVEGADIVDWSAAEAADRVASSGDGQP